MPKKTARRVAHRPKKNWKTDQNHKKSSKQTKLALAVLGLIILVLVAGKAFSIISNFNQPITKGSVERFGVWNNTSNINVVIQTDTVSVLSYNPKDRKILLLELPNSLLVRVPSGFGEWQIGSVYQLGQAENSSGAKLLKGSVANLLGVPIDGYIEFKGGYQTKNSEEVLAVLRDGVFTALKIMPNIKTDLTTKELINLTNGLSSVRFDKIEDYSLVKLNLLSPTELPDGTQVYTTDPDRIDTISSKFSENGVIEDELSIGVYNATDTPGLAQKASRIISNIGGNVIISGNANSGLSRTLVVLGANSSSAAKDMFTAQRLAQIFTSACSDSLKCDTIICGAAELSTKPECSNLDPQVLESRASINVVLGEDFTGRF